MPDELKHSAGPWEAKFHGSRNQGRPPCVCDANGFPILDQSAELTANAQERIGNLALAAAAPDLLAACRMALDMTDHADGCAWQRANISQMQTKEQRRSLWLKCDCHKAAARTAIIKATGLDPMAEE